MHHDSGWFGLWGHGLWGLLFWAVLVIVAIWVIGGLLSAFQIRGRRQDRATDALDERYARGEISREEYEQRRRDLTP